MQTHYANYLIYRIQQPREVVTGPAISLADELGQLGKAHEHAPGGTDGTRQRQEGSSEV